MNSNFTLAIHSLTLLALQPDHISSSDYIAESAGVHPVRIRKVLSFLKSTAISPRKIAKVGGFMNCKTSQRLVILETGVEWKWLF
ncbi:hypothetical protein AM1BK_35920 [Neobacillus kokaensis]|uniref:Transcriptional regulator n=1 Tax=Neobacillus kokaensis TaxID=2759023 RepID=A0ABQ3N540_9BACI|nr:hypothetical protein AM1BK_35920 [Neobacillus kokaensis]